MILTLIEHDRGNLNAASLEMLTLARTLAGELNTPLEAVLIGADARPLAGGLHAYGVAKVHLVTHPRLDDYAPDAWAGSVTHLIETAAPQAVLAAGTDRGSEVMARAAARLALPLAANCTEIHPGDPYEVTRLRWGGSLLEEATLTGTPKLLTTALHTVPAEESPAAGALALEEVTPPLDERDFLVRVVARDEAKGGLSLADAPVVVGGGRGVGSAEGFAMLEDLAALLGGAVGGSRVATNNGWRPHADQIGQTGTRIAPDLYIACGISGAIQHWVGCMGSKNILAINIDPEAPIIAKADYAVIGDLHEVIPALCEELRKR